MTQHLLLTRERVGAMSIAAPPKTFVRAFPMPYVCVCNVSVEIVTATEAFGTILPFTKKGSRFSRRIGVHVRRQRAEFSL
jgi:hypothetical protein